MMSYLNIKDFGAVGDGIRDDTEAFKAALEATAKDNGTLFIPAGVYSIAPVHLPNHITLLGVSGWNSNKNGRSTFSARCDGNALFDLDGTCGTRLIGLTLVGNGLGTQMHGVYSKHGGVEQNNCYEDCRISGFTGCGLNLDWVWVFAVRRCLITGNGGHGLTVPRGYDGWVIDNEIAGNGGAGIWAGPGMVCFTANRISRNTQGGIICDNTQNVNITGNIFDGNGGPALLFKDSRVSSASGNISRGDGVGASAFLLENSNGIAVTGNTLSDKDGTAADFGITAVGLTDCVISNNALYHCSKRTPLNDLGGHQRCVINANPGSNVTV